MRKNRVISRKLSHNLKGWYGYHISKNSKLYKYNFKENNWMIMMGTISRGRIYHILRSPNRRRIRIQASRLVSLAWIPNPSLKMEDLLNGEDGNFSFQRNPMKNTKNYFHLGHR